jgi:hypothetical protein
MYNRYIGNTGRRYTVDDADDVRAGLRGGRPHGGARERAADIPMSPPRGDRGGLLSGLLPSLGLETVDILLLLLFFFLYLESGDIEFLIILAFFALSK